METPTGFHELVAIEQRRIIVHALTVHRGSRTRAAAELGLARTYLQRLIVKLGIADAVRAAWPCRGGDRPRNV